jgi:hypothetical protein
VRSESCVGPARRVARRRRRDDVGVASVVRRSPTKSLQRPGRNRPGASRSRMPQPRRRPTGWRWRAGRRSWLSDAETRRDGAHGRRCCAAIVGPLNQAFERAPRHQAEAARHRGRPWSDSAVRVPTGDHAAAHGSQRAVGSPVGPGLARGCGGCPERRPGACGDVSDGASSPFNGPPALRATARAQRGRAPQRDGDRGHRARRRESRNRRTARLRRFAAKRGPAARRG